MAAHIANQSRTLEPSIFQEISEQIKKQKQGCCFWWCWWRVPSQARSLELDMTHTKQWGVKRLGCLWPFEGKRWGSAHGQSGAEAYWFQTVYLYHRQQPTQTAWTTLSPVRIRSVKPSWQIQDEHDVNMDTRIRHPSIHLYIGGWKQLTRASVWDN